MMGPKKLRLVQQQKTLPPLDVLKEELRGKMEEDGGEMEFQELV